MILYKEYIVGRRGGFSSYHTTLSSAQDEAVRLASLYPDHEYFIYATTCSYKQNTEIIKTYYN